MAEITDEQWERIKPHLPARTRSSKGGRPRADDRACFEGILWILRSGARWKDLPRDRGFPSPATCWRRLGRWERGGVWLRLWEAFLDELDEQGKLDWSECFADATFASAKKRGKCVGKTKRGKGNQARGGGRRPGHSSGTHRPLGLAVGNQNDGADAGPPVASAGSAGAGQGIRLGEVP